MRIAIWHDLPSGGALRALVGQLRALRALGHEVAAWSPNSMGLDFAVDWWPDDVPMHVHPFSGAPRSSYLDRRFDSQCMLHRYRQETLHRHAQHVTAEIEQWKPEVLLVHPCWWYHASPLALYWTGPSVLYLQEPIRPLHEAAPENTWVAPDPPPGPRSLKKIVGGLIRDYRQISVKRRLVRDEIRWVRAFDRVLVNSLFSRESVLRAYGIDATYCPLGVDHGAFTSVLPRPKEKLVVSVGQMDPHKNALLAVDAVGRVPAGERPRLRWYGNRGSSVYLEQVRTLARDRNVDFQYVEGASDQTVAEALSLAACFIYCPRLEPLGLAPLEANLAGTAVVGVAEGGVRETIIDGVNGTLVPNRDAEALANAMLPYLEDLSMASSAGQRARAHVSSMHTWARGGAVLERELERVRAAGKVPLAVEAGVAQTGSAHVTSRPVEMIPRLS